MKRNIRISYFIAFTHNLLFWIGIWLIYYLRFTDYAGVGIVETTWLVTSLIGEIPTGAIADLLGKKYTLFIALFFKFLGEVIMGFAGSLYHLIFAVFTMTIGGVLYSGSYEALLYDSLKQAGEEKRYNKVLANTQTLGLVASAIASIAGSFLYKLTPGAPFFFTAAAFFLGALGTLFLVEPRIDTDKFNLQSYLQKTKAGFQELFKQSMRKASITLILFGSLTFILYNLIEDTLVIEFGYKAEQLGIFYAILYIFVALTSQFAPKFKQIFGVQKGIFFVNLIYVITLIISPKLGLISGGIVIFIRSAFNQITTNLTSDFINQNTSSKNRATTISTYSMLKSIPYALLAVAIGKLMDIFTAKQFASFFSLSFIVIILTQFIFKIKFRKINSYEKN